MKTALAALAALIIAASPVAAQTNTSSAPPAFADRQNNSEVLGTDFMGTPVNGKDGQQLGKITNLVFGQEGRIEFAVIGVGGFLGIGEKEIAVPFDSIKAGEANNKQVFILDATKEQLQAAPAYKTLSGEARKQRIAEWRAKAQQSWADIKNRASKAYDDAKQRIDQSTKPSEQ
jgi:sporulation protein YlmC with PRC-barrel domain